MARQIENALTIVDLDGKNAQKELEKLEKHAFELKNELKELKKQPLTDPKLIRQVEREYAKVRGELNKTKRSTIDVNKVMNNLSGTSLNKLEKAYRKVRASRKAIAQDDPKYKELIATEKQLKAQIDKANGSLRQQKSLFSTIGDGFNKWSGMIMAAAATFTGAVLSIRKASELADIREEKTDYLQALTGLSPEAVAEMEQMAIKTSTSVVEGNIRIKQSADDIVDAYTLVGSQRPELLKNADALHAVTQDAIILSEAAKMELDPAARALANTLNQFNLSADQSRRVINILAAGSQAGSADIEYLSQAIEKTGTTANLMGMQVEQTVGALEAIAPYYKEASMAGNSFDKVLLKLKAEQIGYKDGVFDLNAAVLQLEAMFNSGTSAVDIFGVEHAKMAELLVLNKDQIINYTQAVTGTEKAMEQAAINTDNNAAKLAQAKNKAKEFAIELGKKLQPALTGIVSKGALMLKALTVIVNMFIKYRRILLPLIASLAAYVITIQAAAAWQKLMAKETALVTLAKVAYNKIIDLLRLNIKKATVAQDAFNKTSKANPLGLIVSAAITLYTIFATRLKEINKLQNAVKEDIADATSQIKVQQNAMNDLFDKLKKSNEGSAERKSLIDQINNEYREYLPYLLSEKSSLDEITRAQTAANNEMARNILMKAKQQTLDEELTEVYKKQQKELDKIREDMKDGGFGDDFIASVLKDYGQRIRAGEEAYGAFQSAFKQVRGAYTNFEEEHKAFVKLVNKENAIIKEVTSSYDALISSYSNTPATTNVPVGSQKIISGVLHEWDGQQWVAMTIDDPNVNNNASSNTQKDNIESELWEMAQFQESLLLDAGKFYADYLMNRKDVDESYYGWKKRTEIENNEALRLEYEQHQKAIYDQQMVYAKEAYDTMAREIELNNAKGLYKEGEYEQEKLNLYYASLLQELTLRETFGQDTINIKQQIADAEFDIELRKQEKIRREEEKAVANYNARAEKYKNIASEMGEAVGKIMGDSSKTAVEKQKEVAKELLKITLQSLRNTLQAMIFEAMAREVGQKGLIGLGTGAALSAALGIAYGVAISAIEGFEFGGFTGDGARNQVAGIVHKREFVVNADGTQNPTLNPILHLINDLAANNRLANFDFNTLFSMPGLISGGFANNQKPVISSQSHSPANINLPPEFYKIISDLSLTQKHLANKLDNLEATISYDKQKIADSKIESAKNKARLLG